MTKNHQKTIQDAQAFLESVKEFNKEEDDYAIEFDGTSSDSDRPSSDDGNYSNHSPIKIPKITFGLEPIKFSQSERFGNEINAFRADLLTFIEVFYYNNRKLPTTRELHEKFQDHQQAPRTINGWLPLLDTIAESLLNRGIQPYNTTEDYIDPKFAWAVSLIVNLLDRRTIPAKLKEAGLSTKEWTALLRRKKYYEYFQSRLNQVFDDDIKNSAKIQLANLVNNGDLPAIKYYNELQNIYRPESQNPNQMIAVVLTAVMEILASHVSSEVLSRVAMEIRSSPSVTKVINALESG